MVIATVGGQTSELALVRFYDKQLTADLITPPELGVE